MDKSPLISVIIPTYNQRGLLSNAINSVLAQTYQLFEIIVVDDNNPNTESRRKTEEVMLGYETNPKVCYLKHEKNKNGSAARNTGLRYSQGDYVAFLDDDDEWKPEKLEKELNYLVCHPQYSGVYTFLTIDGKKNPSKVYEGNLVIPYLMNKTSMQTSSLLFRKETIDLIGGFDESFRRHQDYELMVKFFLKGNQVGCVPEFLTEMHSVGGNRLRGKELDSIKEKFLMTFEEPINELDKQFPGLKKKIIVTNYVEIFDSHLSTGEYSCAWNLFRRFFPMSPITFASHFLFLSLNHIKRKL